MTRRFRCGSAPVVAVTVVAWLAFVALLLFADSAHAEGTVPKKTGFTYSCLGDGIVQKGMQYGISPGAACGAAMSGSYSSDDGWVTTTWTSTFTGCGPIEDASTSSPSAVCSYSLLRHKVNRAGASDSLTTSGTSRSFGTMQSTCPENAYETGATCTCQSGYSPNADGSKCDSACASGQVASSGYYDIGANAGADPVLYGCKGNCRVVFGGESPVGSAMVGGVKHWYAKGEYRNTGGKCSAADQVSKQTPDSTTSKPADGCAAGQGTATMNGKTVCVDESTSKPTPESEDKATTKTEKTSTTNPDGSTTTTETTTKTDAKGNKEVTTVRTTTRPDGSSTVETETMGGVTPGGPATEDPGEDEEKGECEKNPSAAGCGGEPSTVGALYTAKEKTMSGVLSAARDSFMASPVGSAVGGFFVVSGGGSCPSWSAHIPFIEADLTIDQFCSEFASNALALFKVCLLVVCSFFAFRVAVE